MISRNVVLDEAHLSRVVKHFMGEGGFSCDVETVGEHRGNPALNTVTWMGLATNGMSVAIPFGHPIGSRVIGTRKEPRQQKNGVRMFTVPVYEDPPPQLPIGTAFEILRPLFFSDRVKVFHEATFDLGSITKYFGEIPPGPYEDTKVIEWLLNENRPQQGLKYHTKRIFGVDYDKENVGKQVEKHPFNKVAFYQYMDALYTWLIYKRDRPKIDKLGLADVYEKIEQPLIYELTDTRLAGTHIDVPRLERLRVTLSDRLVQDEKRVYRAAGRQFNIGSVPQKQHVLFDPKTRGGQGLKPWKKTDSGGWSTDADALSVHKGNPVVDALLQYQDTSKILSTYVNAYLGVEEDKAHGIKGKPRLIANDRIYAEAQQHGTRTGRFSYRAPNLQNLPRAGEEESAGGLIRSVFDAAPGELLVFADYGQIELVILAHYIGRGTMYEGFMKGIDPHTSTAAAALGKDPANITKEERQKYGKSINFAVVYGAGPSKVAQMIGISQKEAKRFLDQYNENSPEVDALRKSVIREARKRRPPHIRTIGGRMRRAPELFSADDGLRMYAERQIFNSLIQGSSADLTKAAIIEANRLFREHNTGARVVLTVHDELGCTSPEENAETVKRLLEQAMTKNFIARKIRVPITADAGIGRTWATAKI